MSPDSEARALGKQAWREAYGDPPAARRRSSPHSSRSVRLFLTLLDLGRDYRIPELTHLARKVYQDFVVPQIEVEEHYVHAVMEMAAAAFGPAAGRK